MRFLYCMAFSIFTLLLACTPKLQIADNTFYSSTREYVASLDPIYAQDFFSSQMTAQVYEGLYHFKHKSQPLILEPLVAEAMPEISKDGTTYTIRLKKNIFFHSHKAFGVLQKRPLVADDFIYSLRRLADASNKSPSFWIVENKIVGLDEWRKKLSEGSADYSTPIAGLKALDSHTLQLRLVEPNYQFLQTLAMTALLIVPREVVQYYGADFGNHAIGTGAFKLDKWLRGSQFRFSKNPHYTTLTDNGKPLPHLDAAVIYEITEATPHRLLFWKGDLDIIQPQRAQQDLLFKNGRLLPELAKKGYELHLAASPDITFLVFNTENPFLKNKMLRKALSLVFDRSFAIEHFYNFNAVAAHGPIPPSLEGYNPEHKSLAPAYDVEKAKELMKQAGFPNGEGLPEFSYEMSSSNQTARQMAEFTKNQLALLNVKIKLTANTWPQFNDKVKKKTADLFDYAWNADYPDAQNFLQLFYSKNISPGPNFANYQNPNFDSLYEKSLRLPSGAERTKLYSEMEKILIADCPWVFLTHRVRPVVAQPWLKNYNFNVIIFDTFKYLSIDSAQKMQMKKQGLRLGES